MATVHVTLTSVSALAARGLTMPVANSVEVGADTVTSSATSAQSALTGQPGLFWTVLPLDGNVWVKFGDNPTAASDSGYLLVAGQPRDFGVTAPSELVAIKDA